MRVHDIEQLDETHSNQDTGPEDVRDIVQLINEKLLKGTLFLHFDGSGHVKGVKFERGAQTTTEFLRELKQSHPN